MAVRNASSARVSWICHFQNKAGSVSSHLVRKRYAPLAGAFAGAPFARRRAGRLRAARRAVRRHRVSHRPLQSRRRPDAFPAEVMLPGHAQRGKACPAHSTTIWRKNLGAAQRQCTHRRPWLRSRTGAAPAYFGLATRGRRDGVRCVRENSVGKRGASTGSAPGGDAKIPAFGCAAKALAMGRAGGKTRAGARAPPSSPPKARAGGAGRPGGAARRDLRRSGRGLADTRVSRGR